MFWFFGYWTIDLLYQSTSIQKYRSRSCCTIEDMLDFAETAFTFFFVKLAEATVKLLLIKNDEIIKATGVVAFIIMILKNA